MTTWWLSEIMKDVGEQPAYDSLAEVAFALDVRGEEATTFEALFQWLLDHVPELNEAWNEARRDLGGGLTLLDVVALRRWAVGVHSQVRTQRKERVATLEKLFELHPRTREMWAQLRQTARDAGLPARWTNRALQVSLRHQELAELLASDDPESLTSDCRYGAFETYLPILEHRLHREEGDVERTRRLYDLVRRKLSNVPPVEIKSDGDDGKP